MLSLASGLKCICCVVFKKELSSPSHFVLIWQVAQMLNQHFHSISRHSSPVRPGGWAQGFISVKCSKNLVSTGEELLKVNFFFILFVVLHTSLKRHHICVCMQSQLV